MTAGLIHRDIKPENVLIADDGRIKIGDFGLARAISTSTSTGALIGTVAYLSPELVLGRQADARSDIYSVGIMLYEMITGRQPFDGEVPIQVAYQHVNSSVGPPPRWCRDSPPKSTSWCSGARPTTPTSGPSTATRCSPSSATSGRNLSDAELDLRPPAARPALPPVPPRRARPPGAPAFRRPGAGERQRRHRGHRRPAAAHRIHHPRQQPDHCDVRGPAPSRLRPAVRPGRRATPATTTPATADGRPQPASKRAQRKHDRDEEKARQRAAATPVRSLREGNPRRRGLLWILVLVIAALLAGGAGWFFGMGPGSPGTIPQLANKTVAEAQQLLRTAGFQSTTKDVFDDDVAARAGGGL